MKAYRDSLLMSVQHATLGTGHLGSSSAPPGMGFNACYYRAGLEMESSNQEAGDYGMASARDKRQLLSAQPVMVER